MHPPLVREFATVSHCVVPANDLDSLSLFVCLKWSKRKVAIGVVVAARCL